MFAKNRGLLYAIALFQGMVFYGSVATLYRQAVGLTFFHITLIESISLGCALLLEIPWGYAADRIGYKRTLVLCSFLYCLSKLVFWRAHSFGGFLAERLLLSVVLSGLSGCDSAFLYLNAQGMNAKKAFALRSALETAGLLVAAVSFSLFLSGNYRLTALLTFAAYAIAFLLSLFLTDVKPAAEPQNRCALTPRALLGEVLADRRFLCYLIACAFVMETNQTITVFLSQIKYLQSGVPVHLFGYLFLLTTLVGMSAMGAPSLGGRMGESGLMLLAGAACLLLCAGTSPFSSVAGVLLLRACASILYPMMQDAQNRQVRHANRATVLSGYSMLMSLIAVFTNLLFGWLADLGASFAMLLGALLSGAGFLLVRRFAGGQRPSGHGA